MTKSWHPMVHYAAMMRPRSRKPEGLYDPQFDHDACGIGFVAQMKAKPSHSIVEKGRTVLLNLAHRGACGCEPNTGDGAGILIQISDNFFRHQSESLKFDLPALGQYAVGMVFLPREARQASQCQDLVSKIVHDEGQSLLGWRLVPTNNEALGPTARSGEPISKQVFVGAGKDIKDADAFERKLYLIRQRIENEMLASGMAESELFHIVSLSCRTIVYKGMFIGDQLFTYYPDILDSKMESNLAMVHSRFSTNTMPSWELAHPFRYISHNGEINTLRGNINWMHARESLFSSEHYPGAQIKKLLPVTREGRSDSAVFDNALEILVMAGWSLPHAVMMMIPEAWQEHQDMSQEKKDFYRYHACLMEPWDGPASIGFTDGKVIGAVLDRNGLRPSRYTVTKDGLVVLASETGVLDIRPEDVLQKGRLQPGKMFLVDLDQGRIVDDEELKTDICRKKPYGKWLKDNLRRLEDLPEPKALDSKAAEPTRTQDLVVEQKIFGYTHEDLRIIMAPMAADKVEPVGSMGTDTPLAVLSKRPQLLFNYFKQLFAQVTNPPLDAIREVLVTSLKTTLGAEGNLLAPDAASCKQIEIDGPILDTVGIKILRGLEKGELRSKVLPMIYEHHQGSRGLDKALDLLCRNAARAVDEGYQILILSDRGTDEAHAPIPSLLATSGVHHYLIRKGKRTLASIVVESGEPREVHHMALLIGYGAGAIHPYLAFETLCDMREQGQLPQGLDDKAAIENYVKALHKGILKVMSKMGVSLVQSYRGAQIFEAIGLNRELIDKYFSGTTSRMQGIGLSGVAKEIEERFKGAFPQRPQGGLDLDWGGQYQWRRDGEIHMWNPQTVHKLQRAVRSGDYSLYREYAKMANDEATRQCTLRGLFHIQRGDPIPLEDVEPVSEIVKRFATGAISYGSIGIEAHANLAIAMNRLGGKSNTGEGGEDADRYSPEKNGDLRRSAIKQVASGRFGVTSHYLVNADELQIKMAQGAKPGEGGQLPGTKVYPWIAKTRNSTPFVGLISPPPHHDIYSIEDLAQLIHDLKNANSQARIAVKLVAEVGVGTIAAGVAKGHADVVLISGHDGGTGASAQSSIKHAGIPWELGLAETQQVLVREKLRDRIIVQTDGQLKTGRDVAIAALLGAEEFGFATSVLVASGCILMRVCHLDTCPVGIATQNPELRKKFMGKPEDVMNFLTFVAEELRGIMASLGFRRVEDMVGRSDLLEVSHAVDHWKARGLDLSAIFFRPENADRDPVRCITVQDHGLELALDQELIAQCAPALTQGHSVQLEMDIRNTNRTVGTMLGAALSRKWGQDGLPHDTIQIKFSGSAGQSFGAFLPQGITLRIEGDSNDYVGKGLSGGKLIVYPPATATFKAHENILVGNVVLYGATSGEAYFSGMAGERFCVRNSGARTVVEGVGDHGCEYMTGGQVVVLGPTGRNFAAGMSGGIAYVFDEANQFKGRCNLEMVDLDPLEASDIVVLKKLVENHARLTQSLLAQSMTKDWDRFLPSFIKVMPIEYKKALKKQKEKV